jgi:hypothetical protein
MSERTPVDVDASTSARRNLDHCKKRLDLLVTDFRSTWSSDRSVGCFIAGRLSFLQRLPSRLDISSRVVIVLDFILFQTLPRIPSERAPVIPVEQCYPGWQQSLVLLAQLVEAEIQ